MIIGTPNKVTSVIRSFCNQIVATLSPIYVAVEPAPKSVKLECFPNVQNYLAENGGSIQYGWRIGEWSGVMLEAEFHAVWCAPGGIYTDITPFSEKQILFLPDPNRSYEGKQVSSIRLALSSSPLVLEFIEIQQKIFEEMNKGELADKHGEISLPTHTFKSLAIRSRELFIKIYQSNASPNSECFCGSGKKYKKCHR